MKKEDLIFWITISIFLIILYGIGIKISKILEEKDYIIKEYKTEIVLLKTTVDYMQDFKKKMQEDPIYDWPVLPEDFKYLTSGFGIRKIPDEIYTGGSLERVHKGVDFAGSYHARIVAVADGTVIDVYPPPNGYFKGHPVLGGMIKIKHKDGRYSVYGHLSEVYVNEYRLRYVKKGQIIGRMGNTGMSAGQHLHFELHDKNDIAIQPLFFLKDPREEY